MADGISIRTTTAEDLDFVLSVERHPYSSAGFVEEGTLRECQKWDGKYESLILMSILGREHRSRSSG